ncbi:MAG: hypothetical protein HBSAPP03_18890 [Phycisphaerae bacterium]|nr:MAG: hypothetical protein HBSAPP03_18890 [Phycisphaerae bacterium]
MSRSDRDIAALVREALRIPPESRAAFLDSSCPDADTRRMVEHRLSRESQDTLAPGQDDLFEPPGHEEPVTPPPSSEGSRRLGKYTILDILGEGGMGVVYLARQDRPERTIALKVVRPGLLTPRMLRRFEHESQMLGRLQHPGIAQIFEAGTADTGHGSQPYFAMEFIKGIPLTEYATARDLPTRHRLQMFIQVCEAVHHAHQKGVIHRDLKPGNILVDDEGRAKVLDFGVARATDDNPAGTLHTEAGAVVGTLAYMSPEQLTGDPLAIDTRADVYALGVILYELLAGRLPFVVERRTLVEVARMVAELEPTPLGTINRTYRGDLQTIVAKALAKEKDRRYQSASDLAADLGRFLRHEPIAARPPSAAYQFRKFAQRNKAVVIGAAAVLAAMVGGLVGIAWQAERATRAAEVAREEADISREVSAFLDRMLRAVNPEEAQGREPTLRELLDSAAADLQTRASIHPRVELALRDTIGHTYHAMSRLDEAETQYEKVLALCRRLYGDNHRATISARRNIVGIRADRGKFDDAERDALAIIADCERVLGANDPETIFARLDLGRVYQETGRWAEAEPILRTGMEAARAAVGDHDQRYITALHNTGTAIKDSGRVAESVGLLREALRLRRDTLGDNHPDTLYTMNNLAAALQRSTSEADRVEAERLMRETLEARTRVLGPDHVATITTTGNLAVALIEQKRLEEARPLAERAYEGWKATLGEDHPKTMIGLGNLAYLYEDLGRDDLAETMYRRVIEVRRKASGGQDPDTWSPMNNLAMLLSRTGKHEEAERQYRELLTLCAGKLPADHLYLAIFRNNFGECLTALEKYEQAEKELLESHALLVSKLGPAHARTLKAVQRLMALYERRGDEPAAARWRASLPAP